MPKLIREGRFGPPKCWKTGSVVGTYPKPMLAICLDKGGLDVIPAKGLIKPPHYLDIDITAEDIITIGQAEFYKYRDKPMAEQPKVLCLDMAASQILDIDLMFTVPKDSQNFPDLVGILNSLLKIKPCPWKTVVFDNFSRLSEVILGYMSSYNPKMLLDARQWAASCGQKIGAINAELVKLPCHYVCIMHESTDKNEITSEVRTEPLIYSQYRGVVGGVLSSFFHQKKINGVPKIDTTDQAYVKGIGQRWPVNLPAECDVTFKAIYGESVKAGEVALL